MFTTPAHPEGLLFFAGGDVSIRGTTSALYTGAIYSRNQCDLAGQGSINGNVLCLGETTVFPAADLANISSIAGDVTITYDCSLTFGAIRKFIGWYQALN